MSKLSHLANSLVGSEIVKLGNAINERIANGAEIYNYTIGDFDPKLFPIPQLLEDEIVAAYKSGKTNYPPADGILSLRKAVAAWYLRSQKISYESNEILIASGGRPLIYALFKILIDEGDRVIYTVPSWNNNHYTSMNKAQHCVVEVYPEYQFMPRAEDIAPHLKGATLLCLCTPQNPTGTTLDTQELKKIIALVLEENANRGSEEKKLYIMFDQMYWTLCFGNIEHHSPVSLDPALKAYTIYVDGISKSFAATGVRVGWAAGPELIISKMKALLSHIGAWSPMAEQHATATFLENASSVDHYLKTFRAQIEERIQYIYHSFKELKAEGYPVDIIEPQAAIYLTISIDLMGQHYQDRLITKQAQVTEFLLNEAQLALVPFYCFGAGDESTWFRMSIGTCKTEDLKKVFIQLRSALEPYKI